MKILYRNDPAEKWELVEAAGYTAEKELQGLLAESPGLIAIGEIREAASPLVYAIREIGLPGSGSTDILAFSARGDIVVVECKLAANVEIKRKVIAQVLEYGAYLWGMSYEELNQRIFQRENKNLAELVRESAVDIEWDEGIFRNAVEENLQKGAFILVIAVDEMNDELSRTIRFLNTCGNPEFAFTALEMRRFSRGTTEILIPHVFGAIAQTGPTPGSKRKQWTEKEFFDAAEARLSPEAVATIRDLYQWTQATADRVLFGEGIEKGSFTFYYLRDGDTTSVFSIYTTGTLMLNYASLSKQVELSQMETFHHSLTEIPAFAHIPPDFIRWPSVKIQNVFLNQPENLQKFKSKVEAFGATIRNQT